MSDRKLLTLFVAAAVVFAATCLTGCNMPPSEMSQAQQACRASGGKLSSYQHEYGDGISFTCTHDGGNMHTQHNTSVEHRL